MTSLARTRSAFLYLMAISFCFACAQNTFAQAVLEQEEQQLLEESFSLDPDSLLGDMAGESEELSRLVDKSTISDLEFLNTGESPATIDQLKAMQEHVAALYKRVEPAVVNIQSGMGQGSGVVVTSDGYILTAAHVISIPNRPAIITFADGTRAKAQTLGLFRKLDAGLLKIYEVIPGIDDDDDEEGVNPKAEDSKSESSDEDSNEETESADDGDSKSEETEKDSGEDPESSMETDTKEADEEAETKDADSEGSSDSDKAETQSEKVDGDDSEQEAEQAEEKEAEGKEAEDEKGGDDSEGDDEADDADADSATESQEKEKSEEEAPRKRRGRRNPFKVQEDLPSFTYLDIGESADLNLGQWVLAVGHPGGLDAERGIVLRIGRINEIETEIDEAYLRTDCTLVGGDSGGPLIGMDGSVIGIHSRIGRRLKMNFHVPSDDYIANWTELLEPLVHDVAPFVDVSFRGKTNVIEEVGRLSLARRSGLKVSDRIIRVADKDVYDKLQFDDAISNFKPFQKVEFEIQRRGKKQVIEVTIGEEPEEK